MTVTLVLTDDQASVLFDAIIEYRDQQEVYLDMEEEESSKESTEEDRSLLLQEIKHLNEIAAMFHSS